VRDGLGPADRVTLARAILACGVAALTADSFGGQAPVAILVALSTIALLLDGVDGQIARRTGTASAFGARFDMEVDALLILVLAALVWQFDKAGAWILAAGLLRYAFVLTSYRLPWMERELPPSRRRQAVCVLQIVSLIAALVPDVVSPWSDAAALAGLLLLVWSFAIEVVWLARRAHG